MSLIVRSSDLHAAGVFTTAPIMKGEQVVEYTGPRITQAEGDRLYDDRPITYLFALGDGEHLIDGHGTAAFINHSCDPNCETEEIDGHIWITAIRNIKAGEEITYDYNLFDGEGEATCYCGSKKCRGTLYSRAEIRRRKREAQKKAKETAGKRE
ncbi:MAG TPA: SET domain-containing protein-lysine N-methyltransferase [Terriglobales bacterium]|nr:SET domain-containing protein-lysine N-methyltransferase [Terriglobales bacterium]